MLFGKRKKKGYWTKIDSAFQPTYYKCSECKSMMRTRTAVCPVCGARMTGRLRYDPRFIDEMSLWE